MRIVVSHVVLRNLVNIYRIKLVTRNKIETKKRVDVKIYLVRVLNKLEKKN